MEDMEKDREQKLEFVKKFAKLNLKDICLKAGISRQAIYRGKISDAKLDIVVDIITNRIADLWEK